MHKKHKNEKKEKKEKEKKNTASIQADKSACAEKNLLLLTEHTVRPGLCCMLSIFLGHG